MRRAAKYSDQQILDAALELVAEDGAHAADVVAFAKRLGAPSGSIYHRFASRGLTLAKLWVRTVKHFQQGFLVALTQRDKRRAACSAKAHVLEWSGAYRSEVRTLAMYRRDDMIALWPGDLAEDISSLDDEVNEAVIRFSRSHFGALDAESVGKASFALMEIPFAAVLQSLSIDRRQSSWILETVVAVSMAALAVSSSNP
ncbi:MAG: TetR/AcrR family transcriptional regulator [Brevibacterium sp.]